MRVITYEGRVAPEIIFSLVANKIRQYQYAIDKSSYVGKLRGTVNWIRTWLSVREPQTILSEAWRRCLVNCDLFSGQVLILYNCAFLSCKPLLGRRTDRRITTRNGAFYMGGPLSNGHTCCVIPSAIIGAPLLVSGQSAVKHIASSKH